MTSVESSLENRGQEIHVEDSPRSLTLNVVIFKNGMIKIV